MTDWLVVIQQSYWPPWGIIVRWQVCRPSRCLHREMLVVDIVIAVWMKASPWHLTFVSTSRAGWFLNQSIDPTHIAALQPCGDSLRLGSFLMQ